MGDARVTGRVSDDRSVTPAEQPPGVDPWGVQVRWIDGQDAERKVADGTLAALHEAIGRAPADLGERAPIVVRGGQALPAGPGDVVCEDGQLRRVGTTVPDDFPLGYHRLHSSGPARALIVSPGSCQLPESRTWGWAIQLYATRSRASWGIGDLADLGRLCTWAHDLGAGFLLVNPLHAVAPILPQQPSPYSPVTRRFLNPLYLRVESLPGADRVDLREVAARGWALNESRYIDRDAVFEVKREAFRRIHAVQADTAQYESWRSRQGVGLQRFALWCALAERYGADWRSWPEPLRRPDGDELAALCAEHAPEVAYHSWLQWALDAQLRDACADMTVIQDLPIGVDGGGADAWALQGQLATGATVGAPADAFNATGQDWGSPPLIPWRLREADYGAFVEAIRATMAMTGGLRIDHILGLFRLWWVPTGRPPAAGGYVRYPGADLLDIVALESQRSDAVVVGEDLGTVEAGVREAMSEHGVLSYRLLWLDDDEPAHWPKLSLAAVTTHDLPTVTGVWTGLDLTEQREHGMGTDVQLSAGQEQLLDRLRTAGLSPEATSEEVVVAAYRLLAHAPSVLVSATLEDALVEPRRPNMPGAGDRDNWCQALALPLEDAMRHPTATAVAQVLNDAVTSR